MGYKHLNIKKPCSQPLENMEDGTNGKFCHSCNHVVHDFSEMSIPELVEILQNNQYSCGIFDKKQLGTLYYVQDPLTKTQGNKNARKKYWSGIAAAIVAGTLQLTSAYSQNPVKTNKLYNRNLAFDKYQGEKSAPVIEQETTLLKKEKFEFQVLDAETKKPLQYTRVEIMGIAGVTDSLGKIDFEFEYQEDTLISFVAKLSLYWYKEEKVRLRLQNCYKKTTVFYLRRETEKNHRETVYGFY